MRKNDKFLAFVSFLTVITFVCVLSLDANDKKGNITYQEGVEEIPGENGEFQKYVYRKDAFYGYASQYQETPRFYNLSYEFKKNHISFKSPQLSEDGHIKGWDLINVHVRGNYDSNGLCTWENLAETPTTGKYYSGSYKDPNTGIIDGFMVDGKGNLLIKVPKTSMYAFLDSEVQKFLQMKTKNGNPQKVVEIKDSAGELIATLDPATHLATAGPNGMLIGIELLDGYLHLGLGMEYQQLHKDTSTAVRTVVPIGKKNAEGKVSDPNVTKLIESATAINANANNLQFLEKSEKKIGVVTDANEKKVDTIQYHGRADVNTVPSNHCFIIDSKENLKELLLKYGYNIPSVDFDRDMIVYYHSLEKDQCSTRIEVDSIIFEKGSLYGLIKTELFSGGDSDGKLAFVIVVLPRSATK